MGSFADTIGFEASPAVTSIGCKMRKNYSLKNLEFMIQNMLLNRGRDKHLETKCNFNFEM